MDDSLKLSVNDGGWEKGASGALLRTKKNGGISVLYPRKPRQVQVSGRTTHARAIRTQAVLDYHAQKNMRPRKMADRPVNHHDAASGFASSQNGNPSLIQYSSELSASGPQSSVASFAHSYPGTPADMTMQYPADPRRLQHAAPPASLGSASAPAHSQSSVASFAHPHHATPADGTTHYPADPRHLHAAAPPPSITAVDVIAQHSADSPRTVSYNYSQQGPYYQQGPAGPLTAFTSEAPATSTDGPAQYSADHQAGQVHSPQPPPPPPTTSVNVPSLYAVDRDVRAYQQPSTTSASIPTQSAVDALRVQSYPPQPSVTSANGPAQGPVEGRVQFPSRPPPMTTATTSTQSCEDAYLLSGENRGPSFPQSQSSAPAQWSGHGVVPSMTTIVAHSGPPLSEGNSLAGDASHIRHHSSIWQQWQDSASTSHMFPSDPAYASNPQLTSQYA
ncbi:hypothetical protein C8T65DRAFT_146170 [Cerioporus squamosus]|nr:hypothetical protein C8T65DRAFT_738569 [Cerioporus squamosus]KAI0715516.1 hypothetical protein C8T65DRAFT_146170 [Cerioporus squamosus]